MADAVGQVRIEFIAVTDQLKGQIADLEKRLDQFGKNGSRGFKSMGGSARNAAAALRELQGGFDSRTLARFLMQSQALSKLFMNPAFLSTVGLVAASYLFVKLTKEVQEFQDKIDKMNRSVQDAYNSMASGSAEANSALAVTNDKLENAIAKLEHKPVNAMKLAIDEAQNSADKLAKSLQTDLEKISQLNSKNTLSEWDAFINKLLHFAESLDVFSKLFGGGLPGIKAAWGKGMQAPSSNASDVKKVEELTQPLNDLIERKNRTTDDLNDAKLNGNQQAIVSNTAKLKDISDKELEARKKLASELAYWASKTGFDPTKASSDPSNKSAALRYNTYATARSQVQSTAVTEMEGDRKAVNDARTAKLEADKAAAATLISDTKTKWEDALAELKSTGKDTAIDVFEFWEQQARSTTNSILKALATKNENNAWGEALKQNREDASDAVKSMVKNGGVGYSPVGPQQGTLGGQFNAPLGSLSEDLSKQFAPDIKKSFEQNAEVAGKLAEAGAQMVEAIDKARDQYAENAIRLAEENGQLTRHAAAVKLSALHEDQYNDDLAKLNLALANTKDPRVANNIRQQIAAAGAQHDITTQSDQNAVQSTTQWGEATKALNDWTNAANDSSAKLVSLAMSTLDGFNSDLLNPNRNRREWRNQFKKTGEDAFRGLGKMGLEKAEGGIFSSLGFGAKADGSKTNPFYVMTVNGGVTDPLGLAKGGPGLIGSLSGFGSMLKSGGGGILSGLGGLAKAVFSGLGFADGGDPPTGQMSIVGENGPELFMPKKAGTIIPNKRAFGGGDTHYHIDARNSSDPAATARMTYAAAKAAHDSAVKNSQQVAAEQKRRTPAAARRN